MASHSAVGQAIEARLVIGLAISFLIFSSPTFWRLFRSDPPSYTLVTIALSLVVARLVMSWPRDSKPPRAMAFGPGVAATAIAAVGFLGLALHRWIEVVLWQPMDPTQGDMLFVVQAGIRNLLNGRDPYATHHVPWAAPLPYGPVLWAPFIVPHVLRADLRLVTTIGQTVIPLWTAVCAVVEAARGRFVTAGAWLTLLAIIVLSPELRIFTAVGHTPSYWPLILLFAVFVTAEQWLAASVTLGLLVAGRTTMAAIVPVFFMAVWWRSRPTLRSALALSAISLALVIAPFALWNPAAMWDGMIASYPRIMKSVVWPSPDEGAIRTIGVTGWLLAHRLQAFVELAQLVTLAAIYVWAWRAIGRRNAPPLPWMAFALLGFSMTTLWPVYYVYFDVLLMFASCAIAQTLNIRTTPIRSVSGWMASIAATALAIWVTIMLVTPLFPIADAASGTHRPFLKGFAPGRDALSGSAVIGGTTARLVLPRRSAAPADIVMNVHPIIPMNSGPQAVTAMLNGVLLGTTYVERGWSDIRFAVPQSAWRSGSNALDLECSSSSRPVEVGLGSEPRHGSLALRRVEVVPK